MRFQLSENLGYPRDIGMQQLVGQQVDVARDTILSYRHAEQCQDSAQKGGHRDGDRMTAFGRLYHLPLRRGPFRLASQKLNAERLD